MKKIFSFTKKKKHPSGTADNASALSDGYDNLKDKDLGKIHKAALQNDLAKLKQLVKKNDVNQLDKENRTALHVACASGHAEAVQFLVDSKAKLDLRDNQSRSALMKAVQGQHEDIVKILLDNRADPNLADINGNTALHLAANIPSISTAALLLQHGAEIDTRNKEGFTPLTVAVREDRIEMAQFLLKERADVNSLDQEERSPLMLAASGGQHGMVKLLLQFDPDVTLQDSKGWSADDYAGKNGHHSCGLLITDHGTKRTHGASASHPGPSKKKRTLGVPSQEVEAGFSLGGPAIDKDFEDNSLSESVSRASKSANDEWHSTEDEEESLEKKTLKVSLGRIFGPKMGEAPALPSLSDSKSEPERRTSVQRIPPSPTALPPAYLPPVSSLPKSPQAASTPLSGSRQEQNSTEDECDNDEEEEQEFNGDDEGDTSDEDNQSEDGGELHDGASAAHDAEVGKDKKRDFRSELGLEKGEEESSWDSESNSELSNIPHKEEHDLDGLHLEETSAVEEPLKEIGGNSSDDRGSLAHEGNALRIKKESPKREPLSVFSKPKEDADIMEELGVGDVDDLEDGSDWDSASTVSKRTLPGRKMPSFGFEEFQEDGNPSGSAQKEEPALPPPSTPQRSLSSGTSQPSTPSKSAPQPQPRASKTILQQPDSQEESDCEQEKTRCAQEASPPDNQLQNVPEPPAVVEPGMAELSLMAEHAKGSLDSEEQQEKAKDDAVDGRGLSSRSSAYAGSDAAERDDDRPEERLGVGEPPWENRYEKLWVEVEKREVKSTYKSVAAELKERFGELCESGRPAGDPPEDATPASSSADEESSDEGEGEVIVRPAARARSAVLLTIPEQRESGQEESVAESPDNSLCDERSAVGAAAPSQLPAAQDQSEGRADRHAGPFSGRTSTAADSVAHLHGAGGSSAGSEGEVEESPMPEPASRDTRPVVSGGEGRGEEDVTKCNPETGSTTAAAATVEEQKWRTSWDGGDAAGEKIVGSKKPETALGSLLNRADGSHQDQQPVPAQSASRAPVQHGCGSRKQERPAVEGALQLEPKVRGARPGRAPQTGKRVNGDPSSVFDDSSLSDLSDDEARLTTRGQQRSKIQTPEEMDMADDLDELTQSSDTATDDMDSPTSGYRHASLLIQKLDSSTLDSTSITKLQNIFHEYERSIEKARSRHGYLAEKVSQLEVERAALKSSLEEVKDVKSLLERNQLELQTEVTNLKFQLKQEQENRHNATMMYNTTRDKLRRMEEQHQFEVQERQKVELTLRNLELETRTLISNMKQARSLTLPACVCPACCFF
uniref:Ankyrin repeat domain-containing protein 26 n=2 Tax=Fundulus heteroclitus TaxID=8078 RepID=A0A3Q2PLV9_FUNHE